MKTVVLILLFALSYSNAQLMAASKTCTAELKMVEKDVMDTYSSPSKLDAATPEMQCHLKCVMEKLGQLKGGVFDVDKAAKDWKEIPELAEFKVTDPKVFVNCKNEKGANDCETAHKINKCIRKNKPAK